MAAVTVVVGCGDDSTNRASGEVVLYTSMPSAVVDRLEGVVERRFPDLDGNYWLPVEGEGISLTVVRGRTADMQKRIDDEIAAGGVKADIIWLAEPSPYEAYKESELLAPVEVPDDARIPAAYIDPDGFYVAGRIISMVVAWNSELLPGGLSDWTDLHQQEAAAFPAPESGAARATIKALLDLYGEDFFVALAEGGGTSVASNGAARDGVAVGTLDAVAVLDYMARQARDDGFPVGFAYPESGTVLIPSPLAITRDAKNPAAARAVIDFILSRSGQEIMVEIGNFYPVRGDVTPPPGAPRLETIRALTVDWSSLGAEVEEIGTLWDELFAGP